MRSGFWASACRDRRTGPSSSGASAISVTPSGRWIRVLTIPPARCGSVCDGSGAATIEPAPAPGDAVGDQPNPAGSAPIGSTSATEAGKSGTAMVLAAEKGLSPAPATGVDAPVSALAVMGAGDAARTGPSLAKPSPSNDIASCDRLAMATTPPCQSRSVAVWADSAFGAGSGSTCTPDRPIKSAFGPISFGSAEADSACAALVGIRSAIVRMRVAGVAVDRGGDSLLGEAESAADGTAISDAAIASAWALAQSTSAFGTSALPDPATGGRCRNGAGKDCSCGAATACPVSGTAPTLLTADPAAASRAVSSRAGVRAPALGAGSSTAARCAKSTTLVLVSGNVDKVSPWGRLSVKAWPAAISAPAGAPAVGSRGAESACGGQNACRTAAAAGMPSGGMICTSSSGVEPCSCGGPASAAVNAAPDPSVKDEVGVTIGPEGPNGDVMAKTDCMFPRLLPLITRLSASEVTHSLPTSRIVLENPTHLEAPWTPHLFRFPPPFHRHGKTS